MFFLMDGELAQIATLVRLCELHSNPHRDSHVFREGWVVCCGTHRLCLFLRFAWHVDYLRQMLEVVNVTEILPNPNVDRNNAREEARQDLRREFKRIRSTSPDKSPPRIRLRPRRPRRRASKASQS
jgi:hypothetical protein